MTWIISVTSTGVLQPGLKRDEQEHQENARHQEQLAREVAERERQKAEAALAEQVQALATAAVQCRLNTRIQSSNNSGVRAQMESSLNTMMVKLDEVVGSFSV